MVSSAVPEQPTHSRVRPCTRCRAVPADRPPLDSTPVLGSRFIIWRRAETLAPDFTTFSATSNPRPQPGGVSKSPPTNPAQMRISRGGRSSCRSTEEDKHNNKMSPGVSHSAGSARHHRDHPTPRWSPPKFRQSALWGNEQSTLVARGLRSKRRRGARCGQAAQRAARRKAIYASGGRAAPPPDELS